MSENTVVTMKFSHVIYRWISYYYLQEDHDMLSPHSRQDELLYLLAYRGLQKVLRLLFLPKNHNITKTKAIIAEPVATNSIKCMALGFSIILKVLAETK